VDIGAEPFTAKVTDLPLGQVLDLLVRTYGLTLLVEPDVDLASHAFIPYLKDVDVATALRVILTPLRYSFRLEGRSLTVFARETRTFRVRVPVVRQSWESSVSNAGGSVSATGGRSGAAAAAETSSGMGRKTGRGRGSSEGGAGLGASVVLKTVYDSVGPWAEIEASIEKLTSSAGSYSVSRASGLVTVTDTPTALEAVKTYVDAVNQEFSRRAHVEVRVLEVSLTDTHASGIDWEVALRSLGTNNLLPHLAVPFSRSGIRSEDAAFSFTVSSRVARALVRAVEEQGAVEIVAQPSLVVNSGLPAIIQIGQVETYVSNVIVTQVANAGTQTSVETSVLSDGVVLGLLPRIEDNGGVVMALSIILQEILDRRRFEISGGGFLELPVTTRRSYAGINDTSPDQTLIIAGLLSTRQSERSTGVPFLSKVPIVGLLFGGHESVKERVEVVIMLTVRAAGAVPATSPVASMRGTGT
jgi:type IVB pilus formation R64 PilN family outer membrane protein